MSWQFIWEQYLLVHLSNFSVVLFTAYCFFSTRTGLAILDENTKTSFFKKKDVWKVSLLFCLFTVYSTLSAKPDGSNMRLLGPLLAGYIGGIKFGLLVSLSGVFALVLDHVYLRLSPLAEQVGHMFLSSLTVTVLAGLCAGACNYYFKKIAILQGMFFVLVFEAVLHWGLTLLLGKPFNVIWQNTLKIFPMMVTIHVLGFGAFLFMLKRLKEEREMQIEEKRLKKELEIASKVQKSFFQKKKIEQETFSVVAQLLNYDCIEGEFYDFYLEENKFIFIVGKVEAGQTVAALGMVLAKALFQTSKLNDNKPCLILTSMNRILCRQYAKGEFMLRAFAGIYDFKEQSLLYANAAYALPILLKSEGETVCLEQREETLMGEFKDFVWSDTKVNLAKGDCLIVANDFKIAKKERLRFVQNHKAVDDIEAILNEETAFLEKKLQDKNKQINTALLVLLCKEGEKNLLKKNLQLFWELNGKKEELERLPMMVEKLADKEKLSKKQKNVLRLIVEELLTNVIKYAQLKDLTQKNIVISYAKNEEMFLLEIKDKGVIFNPLQGNDVLEKGKRTIGGWGLFIVKKEAQEITYERKEEYNVLTVLKKW